jgi:hypothetical protein
MMRASSSPAADSRHRLLPEGRRWGFGAHSIVPYLTLAQHARMGTDGELLASIRNPVFPRMDDALRALRPQQ